MHSRSTASSKQARRRGGAENPIIGFPDADMQMGTRTASASALGCAGQPCLPAPTAFFHFNGWRDSCFGTLHG